MSVKEAQESVVLPSSPCPCWRALEFGRTADTSRAVGAQKFLF